MATVRVRYDRDLGMVVVEPVGGPTTHIEADDLSDAFEVFQDDLSGAYGLKGGKGKTKIGAGVVTGPSIPHAAVTENDLTGKPREDLPVPGAPDKQTILTSGSVPAPVLEKASTGQSATHAEVVDALSQTPAEPAK